MGNQQEDREKTQAEKQKELGTFIRTHREATGYSLRQFAGLLKLSPSYLSDVELGRRTLTKSKMRQIATLLKATRSLDEPPLYQSMLMISGKMSVERMALLSIYETAWKHKEQPGSSGLLPAGSLLDIIALALWHNDQQEQHDFEDWVTKT